MNLHNFGFLLADHMNKRAYRCRYFLVATFLGLALLVGSPSLVNHYKKRISSEWGTAEFLHTSRTISCKSQHKPSGSESLPEGIISRSSNLEMQQIQDLSLSSRPKGNKRASNQGNRRASKCLLAMAVGIKQKEVVNQIVHKFPSSKFTVMLFHYDGIVDRWRDLQWSDSTLHLSAINQTKWWFAKRFLHPDIVAEYAYIFLWDEDLGIEHFHPERYISIIEKEGLEISQPALDTSKSEIHHQITVRGRKGDVHRRVYKQKGSGGCFKNSTAPPCTGWVEMMAPVFSRTAWRCVWNMIQNDLIHAWGLDMKLGYCVQGDRSRKIGVVDSEYIVHWGIPTLGHFDENKAPTCRNIVSCISIVQLVTLRNVVVAFQPNTKTSNQPSGSYQPYEKMHPFLVHLQTIGSPRLTAYDIFQIRRRSYAELKIFQRRWRRAAANDKCWIDPYPEATKINR